MCTLRGSVHGMVAERAVAAWVVCSSGNSLQKFRGSSTVACICEWAL